MTNKDRSFELSKLKIQIDIIRSCIKKSKQVIIGNAILHSLRNSEFFIARFSSVLPSSKYVKELCQETEVRIYDLKRTISILIGRLAFTKEQYFYLGSSFWFSTHDLKAGYVLLYPNINSEHPSYVLFLVKAIDSFDGHIYWPGDIKLYRHVNHVLEDVKGLSPKELGITFTYVTKTEILNELQLLKSTLKFKKNE
jgi:hypothetical protein